MSAPTIAIVGRPNVGKSSLFNGLLGFRRSIVYDRPGTTVDKIVEKSNWGPTLMDTEGAFGEGKFQENIRGVGAILFVVDAVSGPTPFDREIAVKLRQLQKPTLVCVNKSEGKHVFLPSDFSELGFEELVPISAAHKRNLDLIRGWCLTLHEPSEGSHTKPVTIVLIGRPNTGKSTLMNQLCQKHVSRTSPIPLTTRDPVSFELEMEGRKVKLLDTAGVRRPRSQKDSVESLSIQATTRAIQRSDVVLLLIASVETITDQDMRLLNLVMREGKPALILLNFWDRLSPKERKHFMENSELSYYLKDFRTLPISGLTGYHVTQCIPLALSILKKSQKRIKTSHLNEVVKKMIEKNPPPSDGLRNFNILYASQVRAEPPTFVFFMNRKKALPESYQKYLTNELRRRFGLKSQAVRLFFRGE